MSTSKKVDDGLVYDVNLLVPRYWLLRWDVAPFLAVHTVLFFILYTANIYSRDYNGPTKGYTDLIGQSESSGDLNSKDVQIALIGIPVLLTIQLLLFLLGQWSMNLKCNLGYSRVSNIGEARYAHIVASRNAGKDRIVPLLLRSATRSTNDIKIAGKTHSVQGIRFEFQKIAYEYDPDKNTFIKLEYPVSSHIKNYLKHGGYKNDDDYITSIMKWSYNIFDIPVPDFLELYIEHLVAPFFVFQVLCLFLWSLDDYWYYSAFTLLMLMFFEGMLCKQRQQGVQMLRSMRRPPINIQVYRNDEWKLDSSERLTPGDIISLTTNSFDQKIAVEGVEDDVVKSEDYIIPCDALLIRGSCVVNEAMLTGESVPQIKETLKTYDDQENGFIDLKDGQSSDAIWRRHLVFGGTALLQDADDSTDLIGIPSPPGGGATAVVVRTGFGTTQGGLMRKILFATERVNATSSETVYFIGVLIVFAMMASGLVLHGGLQDESRNRFKLVLHCIMIVTSVVPPELPMELSLSVTNSLAALSSNLVFCTEPFRIPFAGKLDILCFDKTGTLTKDKMILRGVVAPKYVPLMAKTHTPSNLANDELDIVPFDDNELYVPDNVLCVMAACNSLFQNQKGAIMGDPLEVTTLKSSGFSPSSDEIANIGGLGILVNKSRDMRITRKKLYPFSSALKRMSVISSVNTLNEKSNDSNLWVFTKGAPEVLENMLDDIPKSYRKVYRHHMSQGKRVLVLACKSLTASKNALEKFTRQEIESKLTFIGFLVYDCDLKADSKSVIRELRQSNHKVMMITGDSADTAADIGRRLLILKADKNLLLLKMIGKGNFVWREASSEGSDDSKLSTDVEFDISSINRLSLENNLCVVGGVLNELGDGNNKARAKMLISIAPHINIFARVSPAQKEEVIHALNGAKLFTLMCGDGTNDVGALKAAHVGVSIVNNPEFEGLVEETAAAENITATAKGEKKAKGASAKDRMGRALAELQKQEADPTIVKLGDASIASPFTARRTSIDSVLSVLRQGRCTLVTTIQVFKILALNCLVSAYMMSALYLKGLKQGDIQMTANGLVTAGLFFFLSQAKPLNRIASTRPPSSIFCLSNAISVGGQFVVHLCCLFATLHICEEYILPDDLTMSADGKFYPNIVNSAVFLLSAIMQVNNFVVNYRGHPYTQSIFDNKALYRSVQVIYGALLLVAGGQFEPINDLLQMAPFPNSQFQVTLLGILALNFAACYSIEKLCQRFLE